MVNSEPRPWTEVTEIRPPRVRTRLDVIANPSPVPGEMESSCGFRWKGQTSERWMKLIRRGYTHLSKRLEAASLDKLIRHAHTRVEDRDNDVVARCGTTE